VPKHTFVSAVVVDRDARALLHRRPDDGLLALLWAFPSSPLSDDADDPVPSAREVAAGSGAFLEPQAPRLLEPVRHRFTHMDVTYRPVLFRGGGDAGPDRRWIGLDTIDQIALSVAEQKIARAAMEALAAT
jgi:A/G-specific adenine glycosylase